MIASAVVARGADGVVRATYSFGIPQWHPTPLNRMMGMNKYVIARLKKRDAKTVWACFLRSGASKATGRRRVTFTIVLKPKQRGCDPDAYDKSLFDALKHCGAIKDDNRQWVEAPPPDFRRGTATEWGIEITLEDIP